MNQRVYSTDEENFSYESIHEAVLSNWESGISEVGDLMVIYEGKPIPNKTSDFLQNNLAEGMSERAWDNYGEFAEDWPNWSAEEELDLIRKMKHCIDEWATLTDNHPKFYHVKDIVEIQVKVTSEDGDWEFV